MTAAAALLLLGSPGTWTCVNLDPLTICQSVGDVCVTASASEVLMLQLDDDRVTITPLAGPTADVARNLIVLRAADAMGLARDRAARRRQESAQR